MAMSTLTVNLPPKHIFKVAKIAEARGISRAECIRQSVGKTIEEYERTNGVIRL